MKPLANLPHILITKSISWLTFVPKIFSLPFFLGGNLLFSHLNQLSNSARPMSDSRLLMDHRSCYSLSTWPINKYILDKYIYVYEEVWRVSRPVMPDPLKPQDYSPPGSSVHEILQTRTLEDSYPFLQGIFLTQGLNLGLPHCRQFLYCLNQCIIHKIILLCV